jgi:NAD(P)H-hydrate epimerase
VGIGPGLGRDPGTAVLLLDFVRALASKQSEAACVLDADALNILAAAGAEARFQWAELAPLNLLITPHPGEAARILQHSVCSTAASDRHACWRELVELTGSCVILKGAGSLIGDATMLQEANPVAFENPTGNPGMATAGTGDVLTGILTGLLARGMSCLDGARLGAWLHGRAGDLAAEAGSPESLIAGDLIDFLPLAWRELAHRAPNS